MCPLPKEWRSPAIAIPTDVILKAWGYKKALTENHELVKPSSAGAVSRKKKKSRAVGKMAQIISVHPSYGRLLYLLVIKYKPNLIIEMGTAFGISTSYLALANPQIPVITIEGNHHFAEIAQQQFTAFHLDNIQVVNGYFKEALPRLDIEADKRLMVFIDGNHTGSATLEYFDFFRKLKNQDCILIFDDIYWSADMMNAWKFIKQTAIEYRYLNLFRCGILIRGY
jgi:predicted O-methyltransferase YrrM